MAVLSLAGHRFSEFACYKADLNHHSNLQDLSGRTDDHFTVTRALFYELRCCYNLRTWTSHLPTLLFFSL